MKQMSDKKLPSFQEFFKAKFKEWENQQPNERSSISAYARWLSANKYQIEIKQQLASDWYLGKYEPADDSYLLVLEEKIGQEIYEILNIPNEDRPDPNLYIVNVKWNFMPLDWRKRIADEAAKYETKNISERVSKASKQRKPRKAK